MRFDVEMQQPVRGADGFCIECDDDEPGEVIGKILRDASKPAARFEGYATQAETDKKILRDVFEKGDVWFRTGDLMRKDAHGYFYFVDRIGDTFRWKGENVSTTEVAEAIGTFDGDLRKPMSMACSVPGRDGRAGMAAIVAADNFNLTALREHLAERLPDYARPVFLRIRQDMDMTATFKQKKVDLVKQGFDPDAIGDPIYFNDPAAKAFVRHRRSAVQADLCPERYGCDDCHARRRARVLARRRPERNGLPRTTRSTPRSERAFCRPMRPPRRANYPTGRRRRRARWR